MSQNDPARSWEDWDARAMEAGLVDVLSEGTPALARPGTLEVLCIVAPMKVMSL